MALMLPTDTHTPSMPVYEMHSDAIERLNRISFAQLGLQERGDIQRLLRECIDVISPETLVIAEEFCSWSEGNRRIDLLGVHKSGDLVVIELKRDDPGHMELQALRYAAMVATMTLDQANDAFQSCLAARGKVEDQGVRRVEDLSNRRPSLESPCVLSWPHPPSIKRLPPPSFGSMIAGSIFLAYGMTPYRSAGGVLLDVERFIPLPGAEEYQIAVRNKAAVQRIVDSEREARNREKYFLRTKTEDLGSLSKRDLIFNIVRIAFDLGVEAQQIEDSIPWKQNLFVSAKGSLSLEEFLHQEGARLAATGLNLEAGYFKHEKRLLEHNGATYLMRSDWGVKTEQAVQNVIKFLPPGHGVVYGIHPRDEIE